MRFNTYIARGRELLVKVAPLLVVLFMVPLLSLLVTSCLSDKFEEPSPKGDEKTVTLQVVIPAASPPKSKAMSQADEYGVGQVSLLIFNHSDKKYVGHFLGRVIAGPTHMGGSSAKLTFEVAIPEGHFDMMVVANGSSILNGSAKGLLKRGTHQSVIEEALTKKMPTTGWYTGSPIPDLFPMWGYIKDVEVPDNLPIIDPIYLTRMVAKVDLQLGGTLVDGSNNSTGLFALNSVRVYNYVEQGRLIPYTDGAFDWTTVTQATLANNITPSLPTGYTIAPWDSKYIDYSVASPGVAFKSEIYLFEAPAGVAPTSGSGDFVDNNCLVIGGSYDGGGVTYYRIDFAKRSIESGVTTYSYLPLLRNNSYTITITDITGDGHSTPEEALQSPPANITAHVLDWNNSDITTIVSDGIYILGLSQGEFNFSSDERGVVDSDNKLTIVTNHWEGWSASVWGDEEGSVPIANDGVSGVPWLRISSASGNGNFPDGDVTSLLLERNSSSDEREGYIHIKAGSLNYILKVVQGLYYLRVTDLVTGEELTSLSFSSNNSLIGVTPIPRQVMLEWSPKGDDLLIARSDGTTPLLWHTPLPDAVGGGRYVLTIDPKAILQGEVESNPFIFKSASLTFSLSSGACSSSLELEQTHYNLTATGFTDVTGEQLSGSGSICANAPWSVVWEESLETGELLTPSREDPIIVGVGDMNSYSFPYLFNEIPDGEVKFTFIPSDPTKQFDPVEVVVKANPLRDISGLAEPVNYRDSPFTGSVGAFWRGEESGERNIHITVSDYQWIDPPICGYWVAQVAWYGEGFEEGDIVLTPGRGENLSLDAELCQLEGNKTYAAGYASGERGVENGINFRVGLKSKWGTSNPNYNPAQPVRYAKIVVRYGENFSHFRYLYLRQGESADYVIHPSDLPLDKREHVRRFSPYNLTAPGMSDSDYTQVELGGGVFTEYPTQGGALFKWAGQPGFERTAWHPTKESVADYGIEEHGSSGTWEPTIFETCPTNHSDGNSYRRPKTDIVGANTTSEFALSLLTNYTASPYSAEQMENAIYGYYADGFFDRRPIAKWANKEQMFFMGELENVEAESYRAAFYGVLFFNNISNSEREGASLFIPIPTNRYYDTRVIFGTAMRYNTSTIGHQPNITYHFVIGYSGFDYYSRMGPSYAHPIRCVVDE